MHGVVSRYCQASVFGALLVIFCCSSVFANEGLHNGWDKLLKKHVVASKEGYDTRVDYAGFIEDKASLQAYLAELAAVTQENYRGWSAHQQLAFLINAYNAHTVALVIEHYADIDSIRDIGGFFSSPWSKKIAPLLGEVRTLDEIEHDMIRSDKGFNEPRIHFAVNCASIGCPALRRQAYRGDVLETQLAEQTRLFLSDPSRNRFAEGKLLVSKIFNWYEDDFEQWRGLSGLRAFLAQYAQALSLNNADANRLRDGEIPITFLDYDWSLNEVR
ncbi:DUF547 domain-containing protein [Alteromonas ponticola]|uniref:DUF547 domain-containing protein n=1 Tax=Alteromonas ponticola TaxID=2720613 RepID=A0ABX1R287_9ALTE|nr:DUF547 domain-containing protein [Alteromonas ponticola]NMH59873.1 DUF547 domain-containing protein [Alteromonas ponticola]